MISRGPWPGGAPANQDGRVERRRKPRARTLLTGKIVYGGGFTMDCCVRNLTDAGAKLSMPQSQVPPDRFHLVVVRVGIAYAAQMVWRDWPYAGAGFQGAHDLSDPPAQALAMRDLWMQLQQR